MAEFCHQLHFEQLPRKTVHFVVQRKFYTASYEDICFQKILLNIAGYRHDARAKDYHPQVVFEDTGSLLLDSWV
ncbi:hypothetical protein BGL52_09935 [Lacticaseibacillus casei]|uniref:Uncharacterized protein n=1 Tax=Lacticaseibacillus casei TaxID=1582 RepID=A0AAN1EZL8_LACCA|nr:hypothetical protein BGL52_09935 [Lacticaseibacillus casei]